MNTYCNVAGNVSIDGTFGIDDNVDYNVNMACERPDSDPEEDLRWYLYQMSDGSDIFDDYFGYMRLLRQDEHPFVTNTDDSDTPSHASTFAGSVTSWLADCIIGCKLCIALLREHKWSRHAETNEHTSA